MGLAPLKAATFGIALTLTTPAISAELLDAASVVNTGAAERVEAAAFLKVLSQETASAACHLAGGINPVEAERLMLEAKVKFDVMLDALEFGSADLHIAEPETRRKTLDRIKSLRTNWRPVYNAAVTMIDAPQDAAALKLIKAQNEAILEEATQLAVTIEGQYANAAELMQSDVMLIEFAARQAVLSQKMAKNSCEIWTGNRSEDRLATLTADMQTFETTLGAMLNGMPAVGIQPAPTPRLKDALTQATKAWSKTKAELLVVISGEGVTDELKGALFHDLNLAMLDMRTIEHLYVEFSKHGTEPGTDS